MVFIWDSRRRERREAGERNLGDKMKLYFFYLIAFPGFYIWGSVNIISPSAGDLDKYPRILTLKICVIIFWNMNFFSFHEETCILILFHESYLICKNIIVLTLFFPTVFVMISFASW